MRSHFKPPTAFALLFCLLPIVGILSSSGCGGGSDNGGNPSTPMPTATATSTPTPTPLNPVAVRTGIIWGPRSREVVHSDGVGGPSSALSAKIILTSTNTAAPGDLTYNANRTVQNGKEVYTSPQTARPGVYLLRVEFYAQKDIQGALVGVAQASATLLSDGTLSTTIATSGTIKSVEVPANQMIAVGQTFALTYTPKDAAGNVIAVTPGSGFVNVVSGSDKLKAQGEDITGLAPSSATVTVTVDDATSAPTTVIVRSNAQITVSPNPVLVSIGLAQTFSASVANDPTNSGVTWTLANQPGSGTLSQTTATSTTYTAPLTEGTYSLTVTSNYDQNASITIPITVASQVKVVVSPSPFTIAIRNTKDFTASVSFIPSGQDGGVTWDILDAAGQPITGNSGGTLSNVQANSVTYTAPGTPGTFILRARSKFDNRQLGTSVISVEAGTLPVIVN